MRLRVMGRGLSERDPPDECGARLGFRRQPAGSGPRDAGGGHRSRSFHGGTKARETPAFHRRLRKHDSSRRRRQHRRRHPDRPGGRPPGRRGQHQLPRRRAQPRAAAGRRRPDGAGRRHQRDPRQHGPEFGVRVLGRCGTAAGPGAVPAAHRPVLRQADEPDGADDAAGLLPAALRAARRDHGLGADDAGLRDPGGRQSGGRRVPVRILRRVPLLGGSGADRRNRAALHRCRRHAGRRLHRDRADEPDPGSRRRDADLGG